MGRACSTYEGAVHRGFWWRDLRDEYHFEDLDIDGRIILKLIIKLRLREWIGLIWLNIGTCGGPS
jgi:hypothetical protein